MSPGEAVFPIAQLVSAPELDAEILFDFNDGLSYPAGDDISLGSPPLLGDPGGVGAEYGYRTISFTLVVKDDEVGAMRQHSDLARQLMRDIVWFRFQLSENTPSVWYRCYRSSPGASSMGQWYRDRYENQWQIDVSLVADGMGVGESISHDVTIGNDPATGGLSTLLPDIRGDAPAPLVIDLAGNDLTYVQPWLSVCPLERARTWPGTVFWQLDSGTLENGAVAQSAPINSSGGTRIRVPVSSDTGDQRRTTVQVSPPFAGRYRVFARAGFEMVSTTGTVVVTVRGAGSAVSQPMRTTLTYAGIGGLGPQMFMVDLGVFTFPKGNVPTSRPYTLGLGGIGVALTLDVTDTAANVGSFYLDYAVAVPCDLPLDAVGPCTTLDFENSARTLGTVTLRINGEDGVAQEVAGTTYSNSNPETPAGEFPTVTPGAQNVLTLLPRRTALSGTTPMRTDRIADSNAVKVSYRPRWVWYPGA